MSIVSDIITRLKDTPSSPFRLCETAAELASIRDKPLALPAVYVLITNESAEPSAYATGKVRQRLEVDIAVVIVTGNVSDSRGAAASSDVDALKQFVRAALLGFELSPEHDPLEYVSGEMIRASNGTVWFECMFSTAFHIEDQP
jgi:hypothetical protein